MGLVSQGKTCGHSDDCAHSLPPNAPQNHAAMCGDKRNQVSDELESALNDLKNFVNNENVGKSANLAAIIYDLPSNSQMRVMIVKMWLFKQMTQRIMTIARIMLKWCNYGN